LVFIHLLDCKAEVAGERPPKDGLGPVELEEPLCWPSGTLEDVEEVPEAVLAMDWPMTTRSELDEAAPAPPALIAGAATGLFFSNSRQPLLRT